MTDLARRSCAHRRRRVAHAAPDRRLRLPDLDDVVRAALRARLLPDADVGRQSLGPRRFRFRACLAESAVGYRPAARRHYRRPLRHRAGALRRRPDVRRRPCPDGACDERAAARYIGRRAHRLRPVGHLVHRRSRDVRKAPAAGMALARLRPRHRGRLVRAIPLLAAVRRADRCGRLAADASHFRREHARSAAALACARDTARRGDATGAANSRCGKRSPRRSRTPPTCFWCSASSPAASSSPSSPCICRPISPTAASPPRSADGRSRPSGSAISSARSPMAGSPIACRSAICSRSTISCGQPPSSPSSRSR